MINKKEIMHLIKALIIDDEEKSRNILKTIVGKYCPEVNVVGLAESADVGYDLFVKTQPDLIFLDVEMPHGSGFDLLKRLPSTDFEVIFVTGFDHYALQAIKFHALDYLLKPVDIDELIQAVHKVKLSLAENLNRQRLSELLNNLNNPNQASHKIAIPTTTGREYIPVENIVRCSADGGCTWFHLIDKRRILSSKNLGEYEKILPDSYNSGVHRFFRVHYGHLINLNFIHIVNRRDNYVQMKDGAKIGIAQRRKSTFLDLLRQINMF